MTEIMIKKHQHFQIGFNCWTLLVFRLRHVHIYQTVRTIPERESLRLPSDGFRLHQSQKGVCLLMTIFDYTYYLLPFYRQVTWDRIVFFQRWGCDEDHDHWEAAEGHACPANSDRHTPRVWRTSENSISLTERSVPRRRYRFVLFPFSGSSQGAEQRHHQRCVSAALQGPGQTVCFLQRWHHQPVRLVVSKLSNLQLEDVSLRMAPNVRFYTAEKYFKMKKSDCKEALEIYKRFLTRVTKIGEFMKLAEVGDDLAATWSWMKI